MIIGIKKGMVVFISAVFAGLLFGNKATFGQEAGGMPAGNPQAASPQAAQIQGANPQAAEQEGIGLQAKISLDLKGMDILDVLKILSMRSGLNIVAGRNVTGRVTLFLKDVNVMDALEIILVANNLAYERRADIINVMTDRDYEMLYGDKFYDKKKVKVIKLEYAKAAEISKALTQIKTNLGKIVVDEASNIIVVMDVPHRIVEMEEVVRQMDVPITTKVFSLNYAVAEKILPKVTEMLTKTIGTARIDERTNKIVVTDLPEKVEEIGKLIMAFDQRDLQVLIETSILEVELTNKFQMGIDWEYIFSQTRVSMKQDLDLGLSKGHSLKLGTAVWGLSPSEKGDFSALIDLLKTVGKVNTLSAPKITAVNNQESKILVGTRQPYATQNVVASDGTSTTSYQITFVDVGIKLYVTPTINEDNFVTLKIRPEVSSTGTPYKYGSPEIEVPVVSTTEAETTVMVRDGATIIIAGLIEDKEDRTDKKLPILGDIPILGYLFRSVDDTKSKKEKVILLTPHIVTGETSFTEIPTAERKRAISKASPMVEEFPKSEAEAELKEAELAQPLPSPVSRREQFSAAAIKRDFYLDYCWELRDRILRILNERYPEEPLKGEVLLSFVLKSDGNLKGEPRIIKEDSSSLGNVVLGSIKEASPFPAFPEEIEGPEETFKVLISFE